jgi:hypothetical protein
MDLKPTIGGPAVGAITVGAVGAVLAEIEDKSSWDVLWNDLFQTFPPVAGIHAGENNVVVYDLIVSRESLLEPYWKLVIDCANLTFSSQMPTYWYNVSFS